MMLADISINLDSSTVLALIGAGGALPAMIVKMLWRIGQRLAVIESRLDIHPPKDDDTDGTISIRRRARA